MKTDELERLLRSTLDDVVRDLPLDHRDHPRAGAREYRRSLSVVEQDHLLEPAKQRSDRPTWRPALVGGVGVTAVLLVLVLVLLPSIAQRQPVAAAAELRQIATNAAIQPADALGQNQLVLNTVKLSILVELDRVQNTLTPEPDGSTNVSGRSFSIPEARATVDGTMREWSNNQGGSCILSTYGSPRFASPTNRKAWQAQGDPGATVPKFHGLDGGPVTYCASNTGPPTLGDSDGVINVSRLSTDSTTLAHELRTGTTGITALDQISPGPGVHKGFDGGFDRAAILLATPTTGVTPAFTSALYGALALMPGVHALGEMTTHTGSTGLGFSGMTSSGRADLIVDPNTGAFLELRGIGSGTFLTNMLPDLGLSLATALYGSDGYSFYLQWVDRTGSPMVVGTDSLPAGTSVPSS